MGAAAVSPGLMIPSVSIFRISFLLVGWGIMQAHDSDG